VCKLFHSHQCVYKFQIKGGDQLEAAFCIARGERARKSKPQCFQQSNEFRFKRRAAFEKHFRGPRVSDLRSGRLREDPSSSQFENEIGRFEGKVCRWRCEIIVRNGIFLFRIGAIGFPFFFVVDGRGGM